MLSFAPFSSAVLVAGGAFSLSIEPVEEGLRSFGAFDGSTGNAGGGGKSLRAI